MSTGLYKSDPLAEQWASRHNGVEVYSTTPSPDDERHAIGDRMEFDELLDYVDEIERRSQRRPNSWSAEGKAAFVDANLIAAACWPNARGDQAISRLREKGYTIEGHEFDEVRQRNADFLAQDWQDTE